MRALAKTRPEPGLELVQRPVPVPGPGDVLLKMEAASICGTDLHLFQWDTWASEIVKPPTILGHELAGRVVGTGAGVTRVAEGDLVGVESHIVDGTCAQCRRGDRHLCRNLKVIGAHVDGGFAEFVVIPEANAIESNGLDPAVVALQEPMGNAVHAAFVEPIEGRTVLVTGCGPIGLCAVGIARAGGASKVIATDTEEYRLELARSMGADLALNARDAATAEAILAATSGDGVEVVLEMSGAQPSPRAGGSACSASSASRSASTFPISSSRRGCASTASTAAASTTAGSGPRRCFGPARSTSRPSSPIASTSPTGSAPST